MFCPPTDTGPIEKTSLKKSAVYRYAVFTELPFTTNQLNKLTMVRDLKIVIHLTIDNMDYSIFDRIRSGDRREARMWAQGLYTSLKDVLTNSAPINSSFAREFLSLAYGKQIEYVAEAIVTLSYGLGDFKQHAKKLESIAAGYFKSGISPRVKV